MPAFANILKTFPKAMINYQALPQQLLKNFDSLLGQAGKFADEASKESLNVLDYKALKSLTDKGFSAMRENELWSSFRNHAKKALVGESKALRENTGKFFMEKIDLANLGAESFYKRNIDFFERALTTKKGVINEIHQKYFSALIYNPKLAEETFGFSQKEVYLALKGKKFTSEPHAEFLNSLGQAYKQMDSENISFFKDVANVGDLDSFITPVNFFSPDLLMKSDKEIADLFIKHTNMNEPEVVKNIVSKIKNNLLKLADDDIEASTRLQTSIRDLRFNSWEDEYAFVKGMNNDWTNGTSLLQQVVRHKEKLATKSFLYREFGANPVKTIEKILTRLSKEQGFSPAEKELLGKQFEQVKQKLDFALDKSFTKNTTLKLYTDVIDKFTSAIYGGPKSLLRQVLVDTSSHSASISKFFMDSSPIGEFWTKRIFSPLSNLFSHAHSSAIKGDPGFKNELGRILNLMGFSSSSNSLFRTFGFSGENSLKLQGVWEQSKSKYVATHLNQLAGKLNEKIQGYSGNIFHFDSVNALNLVRNSAWFSNLTLRNSSWDQFKLAVGPKYRYLEDFHNIGEAEFNALKRIKRTKLTANKYNNFIGVQNDMDVLTWQNILDMDDKIASTFKKTGESNEVFKQRLATSYYQFLADQAQTAQAQITKTTVTAEKLVKRGTFLDFVLRPTVFKFWNITNAQYRNLKRGIGVANYGSPFDGHEIYGFGNPTVLKAWLSAYGFYMGGAVSLMWLRDILDGRTPRKLNVKEIANAEIQSGVFGIPGVLTQQIYDLAKGDLGKSFVLANYLGKADRAKDSTFAAASFAKKSSGVGEIWWVDGVLDNLLRQTLLDDHDRKRLNFWYENNFGSSFLGEE